MIDFSKGQLLRIYLDEAVSYKGSLISELIVAKAQELELAGATVLRGIMGFGAQQKIHTSKILRLSEDLPIIIEIADYENKIERLLPYLDEIIPEGLVTLEQIRIKQYQK